jgi:hypothetical protein
MFSSPDACDHPTSMWMKMTLYKNNKNLNKIKCLLFLKLVFILYIILTNFDILTTDWNSKTRQNQCPCPKCSGSSKLLFPAIYRVDTCFCFDIRIRFFNFPLPTCFYLRSPLFYIISWKIYYPKSRIIFLNFISFQWFCQFYFIFILFSLKWPCYL